MLALLTLILGLAVGFYARQVLDKLNALYDEAVERREAKQVGVVKVQGIANTRNQPIDLISETGGIRKPSPLEIENARQDERARVLRENHR